MVFEGEWIGRQIQNARSGLTVRHRIEIPLISTFSMGHTERELPKYRYNREMRYHRHLFAEFLLPREMEECASGQSFAS
jgi:hypothetical protein